MYNCKNSETHVFAMNTNELISICIYRPKFVYYASDQTIHFLARSTDANTELNGCQLTAVTATLRTKNPPGLGSETYTSTRCLATRYINSHFCAEASKKLLLPKGFSYTHECSFSVVSSLPLMCHTKMEPSAEPAAIRVPSGLNATLDQSQPTLKLSLLQTNKSHTPH